MRNDPWIDPDLQPGDFDVELDRARADQIELHEGNPDATLLIVVSAEDHAKRAG
ncbi:MAG TPA: hypothetical protein VIS95_07625 [Solirubrobacterales bacterium]